MKVLLSVPNESWIHKLVTFAVVRILQDRRHSVTFIAPTQRPYEHSLNLIVLDFLDGDWDYWLNIDADNPPFRNPLDLLEHEPDILGLPTPIYHADGSNSWPICWNVLDAAEGGFREHRDQAGLQDCDAIGSGCMLVSRPVLEGMESPWFVRETDGFGRVTCGPDFYFCRKAKAAGFRVQAHFDYRCEHVNEIPLVEAMRAFSLAGREPTQAQ